MTAEEALNILVAFFTDRDLGTDPIRLDQATIIDSPAVFVDTHLQFCKQHLGKRIAQPYMARLWALKEILTVSEKRDWGEIFDSQKGPGMTQIVKEGLQGPGIDISKTVDRITGGELAPVIEEWIEAQK